MIIILSIIYRSKFTKGMKVKMHFLLKNPNLMTGLRVLCNIMISIQGSMRLFVDSDESDIEIVE